MGMVKQMMLKNFQEIEEYEEYLAQKYANIEEPCEGSVLVIENEK